MITESHAITVTPRPAPHPSDLYANYSGCAESEHAQPVEIVLDRTNGKLFLRRNPHVGPGRPEYEITDYSIWTLCTDRGCPIYLAAEDGDKLLAELVAPMQTYLNWRESGCPEPIEGYGLGITAAIDHVLDAWITAVEYAAEVWGMCSECHEFHFGWDCPEGDEDGD